METARHRFSSHFTDSRTPDDASRRHARSRASDFEDKLLPLSVIYWTVSAVLFIFCGIVGATLLATCSFPLATPTLDEHEVQSFQEKNARQHLLKVTDFGARVVGSVENEILTPRYLLDYFNNLIVENRKKRGRLRIEVDEQIAHMGSLPLSVLGVRFMASVYQNIRNIVVRIHDPMDASTSPKNAILINCHYDTAIGSPGASDDFSSCSTMMEVIRVLLVSQPSITHDLIFLFNGAEENILQASHAFVSQHRWMQQVRMFVNLEAAGCGGRPFVFQTGPGNSWIVDAYAQATHQPFGNVLGQEVFQSGIIPADTDFRIFRDFGRVPGMDIAYIGNGYLYHTTADLVDRILPECLQYAGDSLLALILQIANSPYVTNPQDYQDGDVIFFDWLGVFIVHYHRRLSIFVNLTSVLLAVAPFVLNCVRRQGWWRQVLLALGNHVLCFLTTAAVTLTVGFIMHYLSIRMTWYAVRYNAVGIFVFPMLACMVWHHSRSSNCLWPSARAAEMAHFDAAQLLLSCVVFVLTIMGIGSAYVFVIWIVPSSLSRLLWQVLRSRVRGWNQELVSVCVKLSGFTVPLLYHIYLCQTLLDVFVPIMGRSGTAVLPDVFIAALFVIAGFQPVLYWAGDLYRTSQGTVYWLRRIFLHSTIFYLIFVNVSSIGFPYSSSVTNPRQQRIVLIQINRDFRSLNGSIEQSDSGIWLVPMDQNGIRFLRPHLTELEGQTPIECKARPYCGLPYLYPVAHVFRDETYLLPRPRHQLSPQPQLKVIHRAYSAADTLVNVTFSIHGPSHTHVYFMTGPGVELEAWSPTRERPLPIQVPNEDLLENKHYFIYYSYGARPATPWLMWALFRVTPHLLPSDKAAQVEVALGGQYMHGQNFRGIELERLIASLPKWATSLAWSASYQHWSVPL